MLMRELARVFRESGLRRSSVSRTRHMARVRKGRGPAPRSRTGPKRRPAPGAVGREVQTAAVSDMDCVAPLSPRNRDRHHDTAPGSRQQGVWGGGPAGKWCGRRDSNPHSPKGNGF